MTFVLDNSVALAWCFKDEQTPAVMDLLDSVTETGARTPSLWPLEALNGLLAAERRKRINASTRTRLMAFLRDLPIFLDPDTAGRSWDTTPRLAERFNLSIYDIRRDLSRSRTAPSASNSNPRPFPTRHGNRNRPPAARSLSLPQPFAAEP